jgi:hypothetical protein
MTKSKNPKIVISRACANDMRELPRVALELVDAEAAFAVAKRMAEQTGRTVTVRDADGKLIETFQGATKN